jgi:hypothetical protein
MGACKTLFWELETYANAPLKPPYGEKLIAQEEKLQ